MLKKGVAVQSEGMLKIAVQFTRDKISLETTLVKLAETLQDPRGPSN